jgi:hypothetical protein
VRHDVVDEIADVTEAALLPAIAIHTLRLAEQRLEAITWDHPAVRRLHALAMGIEEPPRLR